MKKSYAIELDKEEEYLLKRKFNCKTDKDLRDALQTAILRLVRKGG